MLSHVVLKELLQYDPDTGLWIWIAKVKHSKMKPGDTAGRVMDNGRRQIRIAGEFYYASRLAWFYMIGSWPKQQIDHVNRNVSDDRWSNLREATQSQNSYNRDYCEESGIMRGIRYCGRQFAVSIGGRYIGLYRFIEEAIVVRDCMLTILAGNFTQERA